ncbi:MAG TPA: HAD family phosphatase [Thermoplasmata archaeon]|nr:HAD family phosphatase [Thermoplasmata archaeon]
MLRLVALDMDGTLVDVESSYHTVHAYFGERNDDGLRRFEANEIDDAEFVRTDVRIWKKHRPDLRLEEIDRILAGAPLMPGAETLVRGLRAQGVTTALVSGGIDLLGHRVARDLGIDVVLANGFEVDDAGRLTGEGIVRVPIWEKERVVAELQDRLGIGPDETASVGNSEIDVGMFRRSRVGIAFKPEDDVVRRGATAIVPGADLGEVLDVLRAFPDVPPAYRA